MKKPEALKILKEAEDCYAQGQSGEAILKYKIVIKWMAKVIEEFSQLTTSDCEKEARLICALKSELSEIAETSKAKMKLVMDGNLSTPSNVNRLKELLAMAGTVEGMEIARIRIWGVLVTHENLKKEQAK